MARKRARTKTVTKYKYRAAKTKTTRHKKGFGGTKFNAEKLGLGAAAYGAVRAPISNKIAELAQNTPLASLGEVGDEITMAGLSYLALKGKLPVVSGMVKKKGLARDATIAGFAVECARLGDYARQKLINRNTSAQPASGLIIG